MATSKVARVEAFLKEQMEDWETTNPTTVYSFLEQTFLAFLAEAEGFSGKRPLGDSGWDSRIDELCEKHNITCKDIVNYFFPMS